MGSLVKRLTKGRKALAERQRQKKVRPDTDTMVSTSSLVAFRIMMCAFFMVAIVISGYAPNKAPKLPEGVRTSCRGPDGSDCIALHWTYLVLLAHHDVLLIIVSCFFKRLYSLFLSVIIFQFCEHGDVTATTGECMCHWQHKVRMVFRVVC